MNRLLYKHKLLDAGLTQTALAELLGISAPGLSQIMNGKPHRKGYKHRPEIARILGVSVKELFGEDNGKRRRGGGQKSAPGGRG